MKTQHGYFIGVYDLPNYCSQFVLFAQFGRGDHNAGSADWDKFATKKVQQLERGLQYMAETNNKAAVEQHFAKLSCQTFRMGPSTGRVCQGKIEVGDNLDSEHLSSLVVVLTSPSNLSAYTLLRAIYQYCFCRNRKNNSLEICSVLIFSFHTDSLI